MKSNRVDLLRFRWIGFRVSMLANARARSMPMPMPMPMLMLMLMPMLMPMLMRAPLLLRWDRC